MHEHSHRASIPHRHRADGRDGAGSPAAPGRAPARRERRRARADTAGRRDLRAPLGTGARGPRPRRGGLVNTEIARRLWLSPETVKSHVASLSPSSARRRGRRRSRSGSARAARLVPPARSESRTIFTQSSGRAIVSPTTTIATGASTAICSSEYFVTHVPTSQTASTARVIGIQRRRLRTAPEATLYGCERERLHVRRRLRRRVPRLPLQLQRRRLRAAGDRGGGQARPRRGERARRGRDRRPRRARRRRPDRGAAQRARPLPRPPLGAHLARRAASRSSTGCASSSSAAPGSTTASRRACSRWSGTRELGDFAYRDPRGGRALLELAPVPSWHELACSTASAPEARPLPAGGATSRAARSRAAARSSAASLSSMRLIEPIGTITSSGGTGCCPSRPRVSSSGRQIVTKP